METNEMIITVLSVLVIILTGTGVFAGATFAKWISFFKEWLEALTKFAQSTHPDSPGGTTWTPEERAANLKELDEAIAATKQLKIFKFLFKKK